VKSDSDTYPSLANQFTKTTNHQPRRKKTKTKKYRRQKEQNGKNPRAMSSFWIFCQKTGPRWKYFIAVRTQILLPSFCFSPGRFPSARFGRLELTNFFSLLSNFQQRKKMDITVWPSILIGRFRTPFCDGAYCILCITPSIDANCREFKNRRYTSLDADLVGLLAFNVSPAPSDPHNPPIRT